MKSTFILFSLMVFGITNAIAEPNKKIKDTLRVEGNCEMCKERIEKVLDTKGISFAEWNVETKILTVVYNPKKIDMMGISKLCNSVGHDTRLSKASDAEYKTLHACCDYRYNPE